LRDAAAEGRLLAVELEHRLGTALSARTYAELDAVVADLPRERAIGMARRRPPLRLRPVTALGLVVLFPVTLALAVTAVVMLAALLTLWTILVAVAGLVLGPRARALGGPWAVACRARRARRTGRGVVGSFTSWR
jgi:Domain of unknown function (DUF1707)